MLLAAAPILGVAEADVAAFLAGASVAAAGGVPISLLSVCFRCPSF